ncbi:helix-turn-helix transcriptional regulator [Brachybacterium kimchii]|uniref:helix-turn-helix transcriptional regulator n=1 Tax=Brachybacterium kimchii TaxID=2942909 RepID=UPI003211AB31
MRIRRTALGATRAQLAERVGIPEATLAAIEAGTYDPRLILGSRLESALELPPGSIDKAGSSDPR